MFLIGYWAAVSNTAYFRSSYQFILYGSAFWISLILAIAGLFFGFKSSKLKESKQVGSGLIYAGILFLLILLAYFVFAYSMSAPW